MSGRYTKSNLITNRKQLDAAKKKRTAAAKKEREAQIQKNIIKIKSKIAANAKNMEKKINIASAKKYLKDKKLASKSKSTKKVTRAKSTKPKQRVYERNI